MNQANLQGNFAKDEWIFLVPIANESFPSAYDHHGECRWYLTEELAFKFTKGANGRLLTCGPALLSPPYSPTSLLEMDLLGKIYKEYRIPGGVYNDFYEMEDDSFLMLNQLFERGTTEDMCVQVNKHTGEIIKKWDLRALLPMNKAGAYSQSAEDWFHASSVWYDKASDSITITGKHQDIIINLDFSSGDINWMLGDPAGWPEDLVDKYFLKNSQTHDFTWCYEMNCAHLLSDGMLICLDNGHLRSKKGETPIPLDECYSRVVCYQVDVENKLFSEYFSYGKEEGNELYSPYLGNCLMYHGGHYFVNFGGCGALNGKSIEPPAFFARAIYPEVEMHMHVMEWCHGKIQYILRLPVNSYYAEKINLPSLNHGRLREIGEIIGHRFESNSFDMDLEWEDAGLLGEVYQFSAKLTQEQLLVSGCFQQGEMVMLLLESITDRTKVPFYMQTTKMPYLTMSKLSLKDTTERPLIYAVSLENLEGKFEICIGINEKKYHTKIYFECPEKI